MRSSKAFKAGAAALTLAVGIAGTGIGVSTISALPAAAQQANPCGAKGAKKVNPCAGKANPCASKANPCAAKANPCAGKNPCAAKNPCGAKNPCAANKK